MLNLGLRVGKLTPEIEALRLDHLLEYVALDRIDPLTEARGDLRTGIIASAVCSAAGARTKPSDFVPEWGKRARDPEELATLLRAMVAQQNARVAARKARESGLNGT